MVANGINGKHNQHDTFLVSHTNTSLNEQIMVKLPICCSSRVLSGRIEGKAHPGYRPKILQRSFQLTWNVSGVK